MGVKEKQEKDKVSFIPSSNLRVPKPGVVAVVAAWLRQDRDFKDILSYTGRGRERERERLKL